MQRLLSFFISSLNLMTQIVVILFGMLATGWISMHSAIAFLNGNMYLGLTLVAVIVATLALAYLWYSRVCPWLNEKEMALRISLFGRIY